MNEIKNVNELVSDLLKIPQHILMHSHILGLADLLVGNLSSKRYFNLKKSAYLLNNPEFDCIKGISGVEHQDLGDWDNHWDNPLDKIEKLSNSLFNQKIKNLNSCSLLKHSEEQNTESLIKFAEDQFGFKQPAFISWQGKHGNHGIFFCEPIEERETFAEKIGLLTNTVPLLGMTHG